MKWLKRINIEIDWFLVFLVIAVIIYIPFACVYYSVKWLYCQLPWVAKRIKEKKILAAKLKELKETKIREMNEKINKLEEKLGLYTRGKLATHYDPIYYKNPIHETTDDWLPHTDYSYTPTVGERIAYLRDLGKKAACGYHGPDIVIAIKSENGDSDFRKPKECHVLLFVRKESYICPEGSKLVEKGAYPLLMVGGNYGEEIKTLAECGPYQDYFVVNVPGQFNRQTVVENKERRLSQYIENFKLKYKKPIQKDIAK